MDLYRVFPWDGDNQRKFVLGGPYYVPRLLQGRGRHDIKEDGIIYASLDPVAAVAEDIQRFRNLQIDNDDFEMPKGLVKALVHFKLSGKPALYDLTDPHQLVTLQLKPATVATHDREKTQQLSKTLYSKKADGFIWWSTLEASWSNITLFESRVTSRLKIQSKIIPLKTSLTYVQEAAKKIGVWI